MKNTTNKLNPAARALMRRLITAGKSDAQIRKELAKRGHSNDFSKSLTSYYRRSLRDTAAAEVAKQAELEKAASAARTQVARTQCLVFVAEDGQEQARLCIMDGALMLMLGAQCVAIAQL